MRHAQKLRVRTLASSWLKLKSLTISFATLYAVSAARSKSNSMVLGAPAKDQGYQPSNSAHCNRLQNAVRARSTHRLYHRIFTRKLRTSALCVPYPQTQIQLVLILLDLALDTKGSVACSSVNTGELQSMLREV